MFKKVLACLLAVIMLCGTCGGFAKTYVPTDGFDFDDSLLGESLTKYSTAYTLTTGSKAEYGSATLDKDSEGNKYLKYTRTKDGEKYTVSCYNLTGGSDVEGIFSIKFSLMRGDANIKTAQLLLSGAAIPGNSAYWLALIFRLDKATVKLSNHEVSIGHTLDIGKWYNFELLYDSVSKKYAVLEDDKFILNFTTTAGEPNGNVMAPFTVLSFETDRTNGLIDTTSGFYGLDNLTVETLSNERTIALSASALKRQIKGASYINGDTLPVKGAGGVDISWSCTDKTLVTADGKITAGEQTKNVDLTAALSFGGTTQYITEKVTIRGVDDNYVEYIPFDTFECEDGLLGKALPEYNSYWRIPEAEAAYGNVTLEKQADGNKYVKYERVKNGKYFKITYTNLSYSDADNIYSMKFSLMRGNENMNDALIMLSGASGGGKYSWLEIKFAFNKNSITMGRIPITLNHGFDVGDWYDYELLYDPDTKMFAMLENGKFICDFVYTEGDGNMAMDFPFKAFEFGANSSKALTDGSQSGFYGIDNVGVKSISNADVVSISYKLIETKIENAAMRAGEQLPLEGLSGATVTWSGEYVTADSKILPSGKTQTENTQVTAHLTYNGKTTEKNYNIRILPENYIFDENFDLPEFESESVGIASFRDFSSATEIEAVKTDENNRALMLSTNGQTAVRAIPNQKGGSAMLSFDLKRTGDAASTFDLEFCDTVLRFDCKNNQIKSPDGDFDTMTVPEIAADEWTKIKIYADLDRHTLSAQIGDTKVTTDFYGCSSLLSETVEFAYAGTARAKYYVDNACLTVSPSVDMLVSEVILKDASDKITPYKTNGGKISNVSVTANREMASGAAVVVTVYYGGKLYDAAIVKTTKTLLADKSERLTTNVSLPDTDADNAEIKIMVLENTYGLNPVAVPFVYNKNKTDKTRIFMCGDSISANYSNGSYPQTGIGQVIGNYFDTNVAVENVSVGGRSTKSLYHEERLQAVMDTVKSGDYLFIKLGHNDSSTDAEKHTEPDTTYKRYLSYYIYMAKSRGAIPVLITPIPLRYFNEDGTFNERDYHLEYVEAMKEFAAEHDIRVIDLYAYFKGLLTAEGGEAFSKEIYMYFEYADREKYETKFTEVGSRFTFSDNDADATNSNSLVCITPNNPFNDVYHINQKGAELAAEYIVSQLKELANPVPIAEYIK